MSDDPRNNGSGSPGRPDDSRGRPRDQVGKPAPNRDRDRRGPRERGSAPSPDPVGPTSPDAPRPKLVREPPAIGAARPFTVDRAAWVAYPGGRGAYGTGHWGLAAVEAIHFARAETPQEPLLEALGPAGRFADLYEEELIALFRNARPIVVPQSGPAPAPRRFSLEEDLS